MYRSFRAILRGLLFILCFAHVCAVSRCVARLTEVGYRIGGYPFRPTRGDVGAVCAPVPFPLFLRPEGQALRSAESEGCVSRQVFGKGLSCCCELVANEAHSHQPGSHCENLVFFLLFLGACASEVLCHLAHCEAKLNVALELACVKAVLLAVCGRCELEKSELDLIQDLE